MSVDVAGTCRTADPTLIAGQRYSLKLDTAGNLRVVGPTGLSSTSMQGTTADGDTAVGNPVLAGGKNITGLARMFRVDDNGALSTNATLAASESHLGEVSNPLIWVDVTPVLDTVAYAAGDVMFVSTVVPSAFRVNSGNAILQSVTLIDKGDQGQPIDLYFAEVNVTTGTINVAPTISDADCAAITAIVPVASGDWKDLGGARVANIKNVGAAVKALTGTKNCYIFGVIGGIGTYAAADLRIRMGFIPN